MFSMKLGSFSSRRINGASLSVKGLMDSLGVFIFGIFPIR
jgi:hypothetical protein